MARTTWLSDWKYGLPFSRASVTAVRKAASRFVEGADERGHPSRCPARRRAWPRSGSPAASACCATRRPIGTQPVTLPRANSMKACSRAARSAPDRSPAASNSRAGFGVDPVGLVGVPGAPGQERPEPVLERRPAGGVDAGRKQRIDGLQRRHGDGAVDVGPVIDDPVGLQDHAVEDSRASARRGPAEPRPGWRG